MENQITLEERSAFRWQLHLRRDGETLYFSITGPKGGYKAAMWLPYAEVRDAILKLEKTE